jgi:rhomboid protease GluP
MAGNVGFVVVYFVSGIAGSLASLAWNPMVVSAGASGAVFGIGGALLGLLVFGHENVPAAVLKQLRNSMTAFLIYNLLYGMTASGIDMAAHVGGLVAGFVCGLILSQPLSLEMLSRRRLRNVVVLVAAAIFLPLAAFALPEAPPDIEAEMLRFAAVEKKAIDTNNTLVRKSQSGTVSDLEFADTLEREVLPPWTETRKRIEELLDVPYADREHLSRLAEFMRCREESWQMQVAGLREQDPVKLEQARDSWARAEAMVKEMTSP